MANFQHLEILRQGVEIWNQWRLDEQKSVLTIDWHDLNLCEANLTAVNLEGANLREADLSEANLERADFREANLAKTSLIATQALETNFQKVILTGACIED
ncbi:MAG: pentapeptide repeat-containing protein [Cyanobacteria bacterium J06592_8]